MKPEIEPQVQRIITGKLLAYICGYRNIKTRFLLYFSWADAVELFYSKTISVLPIENNCNMKDQPKQFVQLVCKMKRTKRTFTSKEYYNTAYKNCIFISRLSQSNAKKLTRSNEQYCDRWFEKGREEKVQSLQGNRLRFHLNYY